jgi:hypothetical protein
MRHRWTELEISRVMYLREQGLKPSQIAPLLGRAYRRPHNVSQIVYQVKRRGAWQVDLFVSGPDGR